MDTQNFPGWHGTTIVTVRKNGKVVVAGDGQVSLGQTIIKHSARKVRPLGDGQVRISLHIMIGHLIMDDFLSKHGGKDHYQGSISIYA